MNNLASLSIAQLQRAISIKEQIELLNAELASVLGASSARTAAPQASVSAPALAKKKFMSQAARAKIAAAQKARWAAKKGVVVAKAPQAPVKVPSSKPKMSAEGRARIIAAQKARWAKVKATQGQAKPEAAKPAQKVVRNISPAAKKKMAEAAKARWAKIKAAKK